MLYIEFEEALERSNVEGLLTELRKANAPRGVYISSPGGEFEFFSTLGPALERQGITTLSGNVCSAAIILYLLGHRRLAFPSSTFFFHEVRTLVRQSGEISISELQEVKEYTEMMFDELDREFYEEWVRKMRAAESWFLQFLTERTGVRSDIFLNLMREEVVLTAREAVQYGIVHEIVLPRSE